MSNRNRLPSIARFVVERRDFASRTREIDVESSQDPSNPNRATHNRYRKKKKNDRSATFRRRARETFFATFGLVE